VPKENIVQVGVIGYGYWGPNLVRNFSDAPGWQVAAVADLSEKRLAEAARRAPSARTTTDFKSLLTDPKIDAIAVVTPVSTHYDLALEALQHDKHVLVEKPLAASAEQCERLIAEAAKRKRVLMVDHTFVYTGAVRRIGDLIAKGELGDVYYYDSVRVNLGLFQHDVNVIWDLGVHDLSIMDFVLGSKEPVAVSATGVSHVNGRPENLAYLTVFFEDNLIAHFHLNWLAPVKVRKTLIGGSRKMIVYDELEPSEKLKVYDKGITTSQAGEDLYKMLVGYRTGDMWAPNLDVTEALKVEVQHFHECITQGKKSSSDGEAGLRVVRILEAATESMAQRGKPVPLTPGKELKAAR
jgi:predicted dehydrogenase